MKTTVTVLTLCLTLSVISHAGAAGWTLHHGQSWQVAGTLKGKKDLSAIDLISSSTGLLASDEGSHVHNVRLNPTERLMTIGQGYALLAPGLEADLEGIAAAPGENCYYVTGSHAVARKTLELEPSRFHIFRVKLDPLTRAASGGRDTASLRPVMESIPELKASMDQPATANGVDIEGLAWREGRLFVGLRAPAGGEHALVLETSAKAVFDGAPADAKLHALPVGRATGIRSLTPVRDGFLFLSGDSGLDRSMAAPALYAWKPGSPPEKLGNLPVSGKPEALAVLSETESVIELLMLSDGPAHGSPVGLQVRKRLLP